ncbi:MAG: hypothetical protein NC417_02440 [Candidatus Gastranaerophilales bacterium]|nr:hypothetical protein [Candidatus Gastranaerophilales bacterium]
MEINPYVPNVHFEQIPIKNLVSNQDYQRHLSQDHIRRAAENFDLCQINPVKVSRRHGTNYVFNGQHTIEIVALVSGSRDTPVWCMVYDDLEYVQEADIFANQQRFVKKLLPYEIFVANIEAGNDEQLIIKALVESFDLRVSGSSKPGCICCVATLEDLYRKYGYTILQRSLRLCIATWEGDAESLTSNFLRGVAYLVVAYEDSLKDEMFVEKVGRSSPREIGRIAKERKAGSMGYAEAMLTLYNKKSGSNGMLKWAKLYEKKRTVYNQNDTF